MVWGPVMLNSQNTKYKKTRKYLVGKSFTSLTFNCDLNNLAIINGLIEPACKTFLRKFSNLTGPFRPVLFILNLTTER